MLYLTLSLLFAVCIVRSQASGQIKLVYIYLTTFEEQETVVENIEGEDCVVFGRADTLKMLGPLQDVYLIARNIANHKKVRKAGQKRTRQPN